MKQNMNETVYRYHQKRREKLRAITGEFEPSIDELELAKQSFFSDGGKVTKLQITKDSVPNVWGDFVKSRVRAYKS